MARLDPEMRWLFWNLDFDRLDADLHVDTILGRVLERGELHHVRWALDYYGPERISCFLRESGHPDLGRRTRALWRAYFKAHDEPWKERHRWMEHSSALWPD